MDYTQCVAHSVRGKNKGQRCKAKGTHLLFYGSGKLKVCSKHFNWYTAHNLGSSPWLVDIIKRNIMGRYNRA